MIGELGVLPAARSEQEVWTETPDYFESYADVAAAKPWVEKTLNDVIDAGVQLSYWWCYQSDRPIGPEQAAALRSHPRAQPGAGGLHRRGEPPAGEAPAPLALAEPPLPGGIHRACQDLPLPGEVFAVAGRTAFVIPGTYGRREEGASRGSGTRRPSPACRVTQNAGCSSISAMRESPLPGSMWASHSAAPQAGHSTLRFMRK